MHLAWSRIWTRVAVSISYDDNHYTTGTCLPSWIAIDRLSIIWKSNLSDKMKRSFFQAAVVSILLYGCTTWTLTKRLEKKLNGIYTRMLRTILNESWRQYPHKAPTIRPPASHYEKLVCKKIPLFREWPSFIYVPHQWKKSFIYWMTFVYIIGHSSVKRTTHISWMTLVDW